MDIEVYIRMYLWDTEFRDYAKGVYAIDDFIERFVVTRINNFTLYTIGNIKYYKYDSGEQRWYMNDQLHRVDGPAVANANGEQRWYINGKLHRLDGPAEIRASGYKAYYQHGEKHRLDGPAAINTNGYKAYYQHGELHRLDGPALTLGNTEEYWEYGKRIR